MNYAPFVRIFIRYAVGGAFGVQTGAALASDTDLVSVGVVIVTGVVTALNEWWYARARKTGGAT